jgi:type IV pilus assembly protein PilA
MLLIKRPRVVHENGFTLIELLVVILIIGVLAAIAIPSFLSQRGKAYDASAKSIARTAQTAEEIAYTDGQAYLSQQVGAGPSGALNTIEGTLIGASATCLGTPPNGDGACGLTATASATGFTVSVASRTGAVFTVVRGASGAVSRTCDVTAAGAGDTGCQAVVGGVGSW